MKVPERNARPVDEAPPGKGEVTAPVVYHKIKRSTRVPAIIAIVIGYIVSFCLLIVGAISLTDTEIFAVGVVLVVFGAGVLGASIKGSWSLSNGPLIHVLTLDAEEIVWGYLGKEERLPVEWLASIDWHVDSDNALTLSLRTHEGKRKSIVYIDYLVPRKSRPKLLAFLKANYPDAALSVSESP